MKLIHLLQGVSAAFHVYTAANTDVQHFANCFASLLSTELPS